MQENTDEDDEDGFGTIEDVDNSERLFDERLAAGSGSDEGMDRSIIEIGFEAFNFFFFERT